MDSLAPDFCISFRDVCDARERIATHVRQTPMLETSGVTVGAVPLWLKCENLQLGSAFKARGATNAVMSLTNEQAAAGVVTHSSGNHAAALARAAVARGIKAHIVMPSNSARVKLQAVRSLGVEPILCEPTSAAREATAADVQLRTGATLVHPFNDPQVIAGQGTAVLEILDQLVDADAVVVPVGGGGLLAGTLIAARAARPDLKVFGAEPEWADDAFRSLKSGRIEPALRTDSIADGLRTPLGTLTFPIIHSLVTDILTVSEEAIRQATLALAHHARLVSEPSGAVSVAAVREHASRFHGLKTVVLISGGNLDDFGLLT